ncbi:unnamed protein product [Paramecium octaurelia]|uniref:Uncharacterized protein n=1 Tax=Paramecium octaurelia TaxID=43137 RepID=A0A8S1XM08_PAROT|nr:unnamed protein product [Paramecium octaurelia]
MIRYRLDQHIFLKFTRYIRIQSQYDFQKPSLQLNKAQKLKDWMDLKYIRGFQVPQILQNKITLQTLESNCILHLFTETNKDLQPLLISRNIKLLVTFVVLQMRNTLKYSLYEPESQWRFEHLEMSYTTTKIVYSGTIFLKFFNKIVHRTPSASFEKGSGSEQFISLSKMIQVSK